MREIKEKRRIKKILFSKITIGLLIVILFFVISATFGVFGKYLETEQNKYAEEVNLIDLNNRKSDLEGEIERLNTDRGIEKEIRENFGFVKEGEKVVIIVDDNISLDDNGAREQVSFFSALLGIIKGIFTLN